MRYASTVLAVLARTTHVPAAHAAFTQHADSLDLAQNPFLDAATWTRLWKAHKQRDWRLALVQHALDDTRRDLVIRREHDVPLLVLFILANPTLTADQELRIARRLNRANPARGLANLRFEVDRLRAQNDASRTRKVPLTVSDHAVDSAAGARVADANTPVASLLLPYALWLSRELAGDGLDTWTTAVTLIAGDYTGTLAELAATSRLLTAPPRAITVAAAPLPPAGPAPTVTSRR